MLEAPVSATSSTLRSASCSLRLADRARGAWPPSPFLHQPAFQKLVFGASVGDEIGKVFRNDHSPIVHRQR